MQNLNQINI